MQEFENQICPYKLRPSPRSRRFLGLVTKASSPTTLPLKVSWQEAVNAFKGGVLSQGSQAQLRGCSTNSPGAMGLLHPGAANSSALAQPGHFPARGNISRPTWGSRCRRGIGPHSTARCASPPCWADRKEIHTLRPFILAIWPAHLSPGCLKWLLGSFCCNPLDWAPTACQTYYPTLVRSSLPPSFPHIWMRQVFPKHLGTKVRIRRQSARGHRAVRTGLARSPSLPPAPPARRARRTDSV